MYGRLMFYKVKTLQIWLYLDIIFMPHFYYVEIKMETILNV